MKALDLTPADINSLDDIQKLPDILQNISAEKIAKMVENIRKVLKYFEESLIYENSFNCA